MFTFIEPLWNERIVDDHGLLKRIVMPYSGNVGADPEAVAQALARLLDERWVDSPWSTLPSITAVTVYFDHAPLETGKLCILVTTAEPVESDEIANRAMARDLWRACRDLTLQCRTPLAPAALELAA